MKDKIYHYMIKQRNGYYIHVIETASVYELTETIAQCYSDFLKSGFTHDDILEFFETMEIIYYTGEEEENEEEENNLYNFNITDFINEELTA